MIIGNQSDKDTIRRRAMIALWLLLTGLGAVVLAAIFFSASVRAAGDSYTTPSGTTDLIFKDGFEAGSFSAWSSSTTDSGDLSVIAAATLVGTRGLQALIE